jgi:epoxyqueuosine reductase
MNEINFDEIIIDSLPDKSKYLYGFADLSGLLSEKYYPYAISLCRKLDDKIIDGITSGPNLEYYNHYLDINNELNNTLESISAKLTNLKINHKLIKPTAHDSELDKDYFKTLNFGFSHKMAATQAGLGWIGKTDLFISKKFGPRIRLATIVIDHLLSLVNSSVKTSNCGNCNICVTKCPAKAATGQLWNSSVKREIFFDPFKCMKKCRELSMKNFNKEISICGICVSVCPVGK